MAYEDHDKTDEPGKWQRFRRALVKSTSAAVAIAVFLVLYALVGGQGSLDRLFSECGMPQSAHIGSFVLLALMVFITVVRISCNSLNTWSTESEVDSFHRRRNNSNMIILLVIGSDLINRLVEKFTPSEVLPSYLLVILALFLLALGSEIIIGPLSFDANAREAFKDEFYCAMRAKASKVGYSMVMLAGCAALLLLNWYQEQATYLLFGVLYAGVAASLLHYDFLIWRADRGC